MEEIAQKIKDTVESIVLIYAFNSTGKTRLCVEYKNLTKDAQSNKHTGVYYNAFSEDLFVWENDEENDNANLQLEVKHSSLNQYHSLLSKEGVEESLKLYNPKYDFELNFHDNQEQGIASISFYAKGGKPIKISRGEERIFVWCFFLSLFELGVWTDEQNAHFFIDDPVSSLDEHNIFITANTIYSLIEENYLKKKIIITTHHIGLFSILANRLKKGDKSGSYKDLTKLFTLSHKGEEIVLKSPNKDVFLFHLHSLQTLELAIKEQLYRYHFVLLRQVLENISSFLGVGNITYTLTQIGVDNAEEKGNLINSHSHKDAYSFQFSEMNESEREVFIDIFTKIETKYNFVLH
nr:AAA family ATPase [Pedobacter sp. ASV2]